MIANEFTIGRFLSEDGNLAHSSVLIIRGSQMLLVFAGTTLLLMRDRIIRIFETLAKLPLRERITRVPIDATPLVLSLVIPWCINLLLVENASHLERFWWLWPLQVVFLASFLSLLTELGWPKWVVLLISFLLVMIVAANPLLLERANSWRREGWTGHDSEEIRVVDYTAQRIKATGRDSVAIGYDIDMERFNLFFNVTDRHYKVGGLLDLLLEYRHGITNTDRCAEGISAEDEYRIVQKPTNGIDKNSDWDRVQVPSDRRFQPIQDFTSYQVDERR